MPHPLPTAVLLVDGYNIIGACSNLKQVRDTDGLETARAALTEALINYSALKGFATQVVFDAQYQKTVGNHQVITQSLSIYYTDFGQTADTYIEKVCASARPDLHQVMPGAASCNQSTYSIYSRLIVATSDRAQQLTVLGYGAEWLSAQQLLHDVESTSRRSRHQHRPHKQSSSRFLVNSIDAKARQRLTQLRMGL